MDLTESDNAHARLNPSTRVLKDGDVGRGGGLKFSPLHSGANELEEAVDGLGWIERGRATLETIRFMVA